ncbi:hypothetical protein BDV19DRAFT_393424 [Aspergillus venezuelensis]
MSDEAGHFSVSLKLLETYLEHDIISSNGESVAQFTWRMFFLYFFSGSTALQTAIRPDHQQLAIVALYILMGADPRITLIIDLESGKLIIGRFITFKVLFPDGQLSGRKSWHAKSAAVLELHILGLQNREARIEVHDRLDRALKAYVKEHGPEIPLQDVVGIVFGPYASQLREPIEWMLERGCELTAPQRQELKEKFEPSLRPLMTWDAAERLRWHQFDIIAEDSD